MRRLSTLIAAGMIFLALVALPFVRAGAQQAAVTWDNLNEKIAGSKTSADHQAVADFYKEQAAETRKKAEVHKQSAETYRKMNITKPPNMANMCDGIAAMWDKIAADYDKLAKAHDDMAKKAGS